jgi:hypothetical protein
MTPTHRHLLTSGFTILAVVAVVGSARAAGAQDRADGIQMAQGQPVYGYYGYPPASAVRPECYLPSDGCPNNYSVQN